MRIKRKSDVQGKPNMQSSNVSTTDSAERGAAKRRRLKKTSVENSVNGAADPIIKSRTKQKAATDRTGSSKESKVCTPASEPTKLGRPSKNAVKGNKVKSEPSRFTRSRQRVASAVATSTPLNKPVKSNQVGRVLPTGKTPQPQSSESKIAHNPKRRLSKSPIVTGGKSANKRIKLDSSFSSSQVPKNRRKSNNGLAEQPKPVVNGSGARKIQTKNTKKSPDTIPAETSNRRKNSKKHAAKILEKDAVKVAKTTTSKQTEEVKETMDVAPKLAGSRSRKKQAKSGNGAAQLSAKPTVMPKTTARTFTKTKKLNGKESSKSKSTSEKPPNPYDFSSSSESENENDPPATSMSQSKLGSRLTPHRPGRGGRNIGKAAGGHAYAFFVSRGGHAGSPMELKQKKEASREARRRGAGATIFLPLPGSGPTQPPMDGASAAARVSDVVACPPDPHEIGDSSVEMSLLHTSLIQKKPTSTPAFGLMGQDPKGKQPSPTRQKQKENRKSLWDMKAPEEASSDFDMWLENFNAELKQLEEFQLSIEKAKK